MKTCIYFYLLFLDDSIVYIYVDMNLDKITRGNMCESVCVCVCLYKLCQSLAVSTVVNQKDSFISVTVLVLNEIVIELHTI